MVANLESFQPHEILKSQTSCLKSTSNTSPNDNQSFQSNAGKVLRLYLNWMRLGGSLNDSGEIDSNSNQIVLIQDDENDLSSSSSVVSSTLENMLDNYGEYKIFDNVNFKSPSLSSFVSNKAQETNHGFKSREKIEDENDQDEDSKLVAQFKARLEARKKSYHQKQLNKTSRSNNENTSIGSASEHLLPTNGRKQDKTLHDRTNQLETVNRNEMPTRKLIKKPLFQNQPSNLFRFVFGL